MGDISALSEKLLRKPLLTAASKLSSLDFSGTSCCEMRLGLGGGVGVVGVSGLLGLGRRSAEYWRVRPAILITEPGELETLRYW